MLLAHGPPLSTEARPYLKRHLCQENELVPFEEPAGRVHVDGIGDLVRQVYHSLFDLLGGGRLLDGFLEDHVEGLERGHGAHGCLQVWALRPLHAVDSGLGTPPGGGAPAPPTSRLPSKGGPGVAAP